MSDNLEQENIENSDESEVTVIDNTPKQTETNLEESSTVPVDDTDESESESESETERLRQEHEAYLNSFPSTTVFYQSIKDEDGIKVLAGTTKKPVTADKLGFLENHMDESELSVILENGKNKYYLKGYEKPEKSIEELQLERYHLIDSQIEAYLDARVKEHNYKSVESCVSYFNSTDDKYRAEARAVSTWRDHIYHTGEQVWQSVLNGLVDYKDVDLAYIINIAGDFSWENNV